MGPKETVTYLTRCAICPETLHLFQNVRIHATDVDANFAGQVTTGVFAARDVARIAPTLLAKYFRPADRPDFVEVVPELRAGVTFAHHDLLALRPIREGVSMIVCKNVLLHFDDIQRASVLRMFHQALQPGGTLVMEHTQKLPEALAPLFQQVASYAQVYRKLDAVLVEHREKDPVLRPHAQRRTDTREEVTVSYVGQPYRRRAKE